VVLLNDYPMRTALSRVEAAEYPAQHLWGYYELRGMYDWVLPRWGYSSIARRIPAAEPLLWKTIAVVGDVLQQGIAVGSVVVRRDTIVYAADLQSSALIGALKRVRLLRCPFVLVVHNGPRNRWSRFWMNGADRIITLDRLTAQQVRSSMGRSADTVTALPWGPSLDSEAYRHLDPAPGVEWDFVCAGRSNRRYDTVRKAARTGRISGQIFTGTTVESFRGGEVDVRPHSGGYLEVLEALNTSRCSLIPLDDVDRLSGLTEAADAMALNVPIVVSKSPKYPYNDADSEQLIIDERDSESIIDAIGGLSRVRSTTRPSAAARSFNMTRYSELLREIFDSL
jgi:glycosyltransferase involved in cell wall biosynthesis